MNDGVKSQIRVMHKTLIQIEKSFAKGADVAWPHLSTYGLTSSQANKSQQVADKARNFGTKFA